jgi:MtN3 and saliva related transmembrane protein
MNWITIMGFVAASLTTCAFLPQVIKTWRMKETRDISLGMYLIFTIGVSLWLGYGILIGDYPIAIANGATLILALIILIAKIRYK